MTNFVIYNTATTMEVSSHATLRGAKISLAALRKRADKATYREIANGVLPQVAIDRRPVYAMTDRDNYNKNVVYMKEVTNLMTGKKVLEPSNTPYYCSVASETYFSR